MNLNGKFKSLYLRLNKAGQHRFDVFVSEVHSAHLSSDSQDKLMSLMLGSLIQCYPAPTIRFINFNDLIRLDQFPRCPNDQHLTVELDSIDRSSSFLVFISHCWMRGHSGSEGWDGKAHPDNVTNDKFKLCVEGIKRTKEVYAPRMKDCFVWIDFGCMNQDSKEILSEELENYDRIIQHCDCLFTPIVDPDHELKDFADDGTNIMQCFDAKSWNIGPEAYLNRGWCRVEMMYAALLPVLHNFDEGRSVERHTLFEAGLAYHCSQNRRPHFLYSTKDLHFIGPPKLLPPLQYSYFEKYHPLRGNLSVESDIEHIRMLIQELMPYLNDRKLHTGYTGNTDGKGLRHGHGVMVYENGDVYEGQWCDDMRSGFGHFRNANGDQYEGLWKNDDFCGEGLYDGSVGVYKGDFNFGLPHGTGTMKYLDGSVVSGDWKCGKVCGRATVSYSTGGFYKGEWKDNKKHGHGVEKYDDGGHYSGNFSNNERHGFGTYVNSSEDPNYSENTKDRRPSFGVFKYSSGSMYEGEWKCGKIHGYGTCKYSNGDAYEGEWKADHMHGHGTYRHTNGALYRGEWANGSKHGHGTYLYFDGNQYDGEWMDGKKHGHGTYRYANGDVYEGEWEDDHKHGLGSYQSALGEVYDGEWNRGNRHGHGSYRYYTGDEYEGGWKDDKRHGQGIYRSAMGDVYEGEWKDDEKCGHGTCRDANGNILNLEWEKDLFLRLDGRMTSVSQTESSEDTVLFIIPLRKKYMLLRNLALTCTLAVSLDPSTVQWWGLGENKSDP